MFDESPLCDSGHTTATNFFADFDFNHHTSCIKFLVTDSACWTIWAKDIFNDFSGLADEFTLDPHSWVFKGIFNVPFRKLAQAQKSQIVRSPDGFIGQVGFLRTFPHTNYRKPAASRMC